MTAIQTRHANSVRAFLTLLEEGPVMSVDMKEANVPSNIKTITQNHGYAKVDKRGSGAQWTITDEGKAYLKTAVTPTEAIADAEADAKAA